MKTREYKTYKFDELSEEAKEKALEQFWSINVDGEWWESTYEDAKTVGLKIEKFDLDYNKIKGGFTEDACFTAHRIIDNHGESCETYQTAKKFLSERDAIVEKFSQHGHRPEDMDEELDELENDFKYSILEDYRILLQKDYSYLTGREAVEETIIANDYDFLEDGTRD